MQADPPDTPHRQEITAQEIAESGVNTVSLGSHDGAVFQPLHATRIVKIYPIQEYEMEALNDLGGNATLWTSIGSSALALVAGCVWTMIDAPKETKTNTGAIGFTILCAIIAIAAFYIADKYRGKKKTRLDKILSECKM